MVFLDRTRADCRGSFRGVEKRKKKEVREANRGRGREKEKLPINLSTKAKLTAAATHASNALL